MWPARQRNPICDETATHSKNGTRMKTKTRHLLARRTPPACASRMRQNNCQQLT